MWLACAVLCSVAAWWGAIGDPGSARNSSDADVGGADDAWAAARCEDPETVAKLPQVEHFAVMLIQWGFRDVVESQNAVALTPLQILPWGVMVVFFGLSLQSQGSPITLWDGISTMMSLSMRPWQWPPIEASKSRRQDGEIIYNQRWIVHEPIKGVLLVAVNMLLSQPQGRVLDRVCPMGWSLALLLKMEFDLAVFLQELSADVGQVDVSRLEELHRLHDANFASKSYFRHVGGHLLQAPDAPKKFRPWLEALTDVARARVAALFAYADQLLAPPPPLSFGAKQRLHRSMEATWAGLDRLRTAAEIGFLGEEPYGMNPPRSQRPGVLCLERTPEMRHVERGFTGPFRTFWRRLSESLEALFTWSLASLGAGPRRMLLWRGAALIEQNFSFAWQACAPAAMAVVILRADRWLANLNQALSYRGTPENCIMQHLAERGMTRFKALRDRFQQEHPTLSRRWVRVIEVAQVRVKDRIKIMLHASDLNVDGGPIKGREEEEKAVRRHMERYFCHSSLGTGVLPLLASRPEPAVHLIRMGLRKRPRSLSVPHGSKLAFLFMVYDQPNFPRVWRRFFADATRSNHLILLHASRPRKVGKVEAVSEDLRFFDQFRIAWQPSLWVNISLVMFGLLDRALQDRAVQKAVFVSQDMIPMASFPAIHRWALADPWHSWFCMDYEYTRSEVWMHLTRDHMAELFAHRDVILQMLDARGMVDGEEMAVQVLYLLREQTRIRDRCVVFTQWALPKYFAVGRSAPLGRAPALVGEYTKGFVNACGHPTRFDSLTAASLRTLLGSARPERFWFARKFARNTTVLLGPSDDPESHQQPLEDFLIDELFEGQQQAKRGMPLAQSGSMAVQ